MSSTSPSSTYNPSTFRSCHHITSALNSNAKQTILENYGLAVLVSLINSSDYNKYYNRKAHPHSHENRKKTGKVLVEPRKLYSLRADALKCKDCHTNCGTSFMCLQCPNVGCWSLNHASKHSKTSNHHFGIDTKLGVIFCFKCGTYVGEERIEAMREKKIKQLHSRFSCNGQLPVYFNPNISSNEKQFINENSTLPSYKATTGLRGFYNMGSTCFMSSILQSLLHNPLIRNFFLSGRHTDCDRNKDHCIACCIDEIFTEFYSSSVTSGYGPTSFLIAAWNSNKSFAGYSQQDAHEFWQFLVNELHKITAYEAIEEVRKEKGDVISNGQVIQSYPDSKNLDQYSIDGNCPCFIHETFGGLLQSNVKCQHCHNITTTIDPMLDLSLEIRKDIPKDGALQKLTDCLDRFTGVEKLDMMIYCSKCDAQRNVTKKLTIKKLPVVLSIQLKRFEHFASSAKIQTHVQFPLIINMKDYVTQENTPEATFGEKANEDGLIYELFAVICHIGSVNTGHYICMVKSREGRWFRFDDAVVSLVTPTQVLDTNAYLLYYIMQDIP